MAKTLYDPKGNRFADNAIDQFLKMGQEPTNELVDTVKLFMENHGRYISASQLRNVYARIRFAHGDHDKAIKQLPLLRVKLAYIRGKADRRSKGFHLLLETLDEMVVRIADSDDKAAGIQSLSTFFESILAYHKYFENVKIKRS